MYDSYDSGFPWIKFAILSIPLIILMWILAPSLKWKLLFTIAVPIGVGLALTGKSLKGFTPRTRRFAGEAR